MVLIETAKRVLQIEADAVLALQSRLDGAFTQAVKMILSCDGKVVITGMGKSGLICQKIAATMASTGTPTFFSTQPKGFMAILGCWLREMWLLPSPILARLRRSAEFCP